MRKWSRNKREKRNTCGAVLIGITSKLRRRYRPKKRASARFFLSYTRWVLAPENLPKTHARRLREIYRSAGWPCLDTIEIELLALGLLARITDHEGRETLRVTDAGIAALARAHARNRALTNKHETLVARVARLMQREGRIVWTRLSALAVAGQAEEKTTWRFSMPDVFSIRNSSVEAMLEPIVHEIKVNRADVLSDLRNEAKREAYLSLSSQAFYVLAEGIATPEEIPEPFGVIVVNNEEIRCERFAAKRECKISFGIWMALAKSTPLAQSEESQAWLPNATNSPETAPQVLSFK
jgi:predicted nucleic acid-binding protein